MTQAARCSRCVREKPNPRGKILDKGKILGEPIVKCSIHGWKFVHKSVSQRIREGIRRMVRQVTVK